MLGRAIFLSQLLFVYVILLLYDGSRRNDLKLKENLDLYDIATGMSLSLG
jgi:hypothetical protein